MPHVSLDDAMFLLGESMGKPSHVIALQLFEPPPDAPPDYTETLYRDLLAHDDVNPVFRKHPRRRLLSPTTLEWVDDGVDLDYHVRRAALPRPGRVRELLEAVSLQHGVLLDRHRPLWEFHLYEGLADGRFATTFKTHHALADGMSLARFTLEGMSADPQGRECTPPWVNRAGYETASKPTGHRRTPRPLESAKLAASAVRTLRDMAGDTSAHVPYEAPRSIFNTRITGARRFAGDKWPLARLKAVSTSAGCSVNDVVLAMCGSALRDYLLDIEELPDRSLIAMVPISLRRPGSDMEGSAGGNAFGSILCDLRTDDVDAVTRLESIARTVRVAKERMTSLTRQQAIAVSRLIMGGSAVSALTGITATPRQPFNLVISNVPATPMPLYLNGAQLTDIYPISMISEGQAINITVTPYAQNITFGIVGDRKLVPHLQRLLTHLENALQALEKEHA
jgi:diacylglycerol O-acyltransferase / wax synthase